nr:hypothetical protein [Tanacetum cinerariifolium]
SWIQMEDLAILVADAFTDANTGKFLRQLNGKQKMQETKYKAQVCY